MGFNTTHMGETEPYFVVAWTFDETTFGDPELCTGVFSDLLV